MSDERFAESRLIDFEKRLRGMNHQLNRAHAELEDQYKAKKALEDRIARLERESREQLETLGELANRLAALEDWKVRLRTFLNARLPNSQNGQLTDGN